MVGINLPSNKKMSIQSEILEFIKPNYLYIPLVNYNNLDCDCLVKEGDLVYKGSVIGISNDQFNMPIHSSVSGKVIGIEKHFYLDGNEVNCVIVENDFKEKVIDKKVYKQKITDYTKKEFVDLLKNCGIVGLGGSGFPTYIKYDTNLPIDIVLVNAVECEPYITTDYVLMREKTEEILDSLDAIIEINDASKGIIAIKSYNLDIVDEFKKYIGTYPKIEIAIVDDLYPNGWEKKLIKQVLNVDYDKIPIEKGIVVNNVSTIYAIYEALKYNKPLIEKIITVTGEKVMKPQNIVVKIGSSFKDILDFINGIEAGEDVKLIAGGPMMGVSIASDKAVVSKNLNCILIIENDKNHPLINCMRCGKCIEVCPVDLSPVLIKNAINNKEALKYLNPKKCIDCGLCSYICPSKIAVRNYVRKAKLSGS